MAAKTINMKELNKEIDGIAKAHPAIARKAVVSGLARSIPDLVKASPVDTGQYASSWDFTETEKSVFLGNYAPHAAIIEYGARPFTPPIEPLLAWAKRVLGDASQPPNYSERVRALAYGTQKKIAERGMRPRKIMENMLPEILKNIKEEFEKLNG